jgi:hypothetical protein
MSYNQRRIKMPRIKMIILKIKYSLDKKVKIKVLASKQFLIQIKSMKYKFKNN